MNGAASNQTGVSVQVRGLRKQFNGQEVLKGLDFEVKPGEIFVIMGPSGSGKTVLLKHLIGLETPDAGEILIDGQSVQLPEMMSKYRMAMVFQSGALLSSLTVGENVGLYLTEHHLKPPEEIARIVAEKLEVVGLKGAERKHMRNTLETRLGIFVALSVIAAVLILETVGGIERFRRGYRLMAEFNNVQDLKAGDRVKMAGFEVGRVEEIKPDYEKNKVRVAMKLR